MANDGEKAGGRRWRRWALAGWASVAALLVLPFLAMLLMAASH